MRHLPESDKASQKCFSCFIKYVFKSTDNYPSQLGAYADCILYMLDATSIRKIPPNFTKSLDMFYKIFI